MRAHLLWEVFKGIPLVVNLGGSAGGDSFWEHNRNTESEAMGGLAELSGARRPHTGILGRIPAQVTVQRYGSPKSGQRDLCPPSYTQPPEPRLITWGITPPLSVESTPWSRGSKGSLGGRTKGAPSWEEGEHVQVGGGK